MTTLGGGCHRSTPLRSRVAVVCVLLFFGPLMQSCTGSGSDPVIDPVGSILQGFTSSVDEILVQLGSTATDVTRQLGGQIQLIIDQATSAFATELNTAVNDVDAETKQTLNQIRGLVDDLGQQSQQVLTQASDSAQLLLSKIPFINNNPRVTSYTPRFTTPDASASGLLMRLDGSFVHATDPGYTPDLKVNGTVVKNALKSTELTRLEFMLPAKLFITPGQPAPDVEVDLPYDKGSVFHKTVVPGVFHFYITTLPNSPVQNVILSKTTQLPPKTTRTDINSQQYDYSSLDCKDHNDSIPFGPPPPGSVIDMTSVHIDVLDGYPKGPSGTVTGPNLHGLSATGFSVNVSTTAACFWPVVEGGRTHFSVHYTILKTEQGEVHTDSCELHGPPGCPDLSLQWGGSQDVAVPQNPGTWRLILVLFNGTNIAVGPGGVVPTNPWVRVQDLSNHLQYDATALDKLPYNAMTYAGTP
jgi:hypothetical protein